MNFLMFNTIVMAEPWGLRSELELLVLRLTTRLLSSSVVEMVKSFSKNHVDT